jgi:hypothetical protein
MVLPKNLARRLIDPDVIAQTLAHLVDAVQAFQQRQRHDHLGGLPEHFLQFTAQQQIEQLVRAAQFDIRLDHDGIVGLDQRIEEFHQRDGLLRGISLGEIVAGEHLRHRHMRGETDHLLEAHRRKPLRIEPDFRFGRVENFEHLFFIGLGVGLDLFLGQGFSRLRTARGIADHAGKIADDKHHRVSAVLKFAQLVQPDHMPQMDVGRGGIGAVFDAERAAFLPADFQFGPQIVRRMQIDRPRGQSLKYLFHVHNGLPFFD